MTQEDKELLLIDLCARLPYDLIVRVLDINDSTYQKDGNLYNIKYLEGDYNGVPYLFDVDNQACLSYITEIQPYLRPMSSMTKEEKEELKELHFCYKDGHIVNDEDNDFKPIIVDEAHCSCIIDWLNAHHFDYRGLIPKNLALPAHVGMY